MVVCSSAAAATPGSVPRSTARRGRRATRSAVVCKACRNKACSSRSTGCSTEFQPSLARCAGTVSANPGAHPSSYQRRRCRESSLQVGSTREASGCSRAITSPSGSSQTTARTRCGVGTGRRTMPKAISPCRSSSSWSAVPTERIRSFTPASRPPWRRLPDSPFSTSMRTSAGTPPHTPTDQTRGAGATAAMAERNWLGIPWISLRKARPPVVSSTPRELRMKRAAPTRCSRRRIC